jgi:acetyltransferase-like isoleucine patch superfamily enzyme
MRQIDRDRLPHLVNVACHMASKSYFTFSAQLLARWWGVCLGPGCIFNGLPRFRRHPASRITIGARCSFNSSHVSNLIGVNHPCVVSTLKEGAEIDIGSHCGFSGTAIACASRIILAENVRCGANTLITDTDWHTDDPRTGPDLPVALESGVWLGVNVTVLKGVTIGENTLVAAGSLVTHSLPANVVAGGVPAKVLKEIPCPAARVAQQWPKRSI